MTMKNFCEAANALRAAIHDIAMDACGDPDEPDEPYMVRFDCADVGRVVLRLSGTGAFVMPDGSGCVVHWTAADEAEHETAYFVALSAVEEGCEIYPVEED